MDKFRLNYMESLGRVIAVVPSEELFARLSKPESGNRPVSSRRVN